MIKPVLYFSIKNEWVSSKNTKEGFRESISRIFTITLKWLVKLQLDPLKSFIKPKHI